MEVLIKGSLPFLSMDVFVVLFVLLMFICLRRVLCIRNLRIQDADEVGSCCTLSSFKFGLVGLSSKNSDLILISLVRSF